MAGVAIECVLFSGARSTALVRFSDGALTQTSGAMIDPLNPATAASSSQTTNLAVLNATDTMIARIYVQTFYSMYNYTITIITVLTLDLKHFFKDLDTDFRGYF